MNFYINKEINTNFDTAIQRITDALKEEGFGVISEVDMQGTFKNKLGVDFRRYTILGACNPQYAFKALKEEDKVGTMLPCNVIVQEWEENRIEVAAVDPKASLLAIENSQVASIAEEIQVKLKRVVESL